MRILLCFYQHKENKEPTEAAYLRSAFLLFNEFGEMTENVHDALSSRIRCIPCQQAIFRDVDACTRSMT